LTRRWLLSGTRPSRAADALDAPMYHNLLQCLRAWSLTPSRLSHRRAIGACPTHIVTRARAFPVKDLKDSTDSRLARLLLPSRNSGRWRRISFLDATRKPVVMCTFSFNSCTFRLLPPSSASLS
jgi:hypothetical protein